MLAYAVLDYNDGDRRALLTWGGCALGHERDLLLLPAAVTGGCCPWSTRRSRRALLTRDGCALGHDKALPVLLLPAAGTDGCCPWSTRG